MEARPYKSTAVFDQNSLPSALRRDHSTRAEVWGVIRVLEGRLRLAFADGTPERVLGPGGAGLVRPEQVHVVEPLGAMQMQVDFYDAEPAFNDS